MGKKQRKEIVNLCVRPLVALDYFSILRNPAVNLECVRLCSFGLPWTPSGFPREVCAVFFFWGAGGSSPVPGSRPLALLANGCSHLP